MKIALVYTGAVLIPELNAQFKAAYPQAEFITLLDDSLLMECKKAGGMTKAVLRQLANLYQYASDAGADCIVNTCSSIGASIDVANEILDIPVYRIDQPMAQQAVATASRIGVIATLQTTLQPTCDLLYKCAAEAGKEIAIVDGLANGAYEAACSGDKESHDRLIAETAQKIAGDCEVIVLAQGSMQRMEKALAEQTGIPVYSSPSLFLKSFQP